MKSYTSIDDYIEKQPEQTRPVLQKIRETIHGASPDTVEVISYGIPTFKLNGKNLVHFAVFKDHFSFFPTSSGVLAFKKELKNYNCSRGTIQFSFEKPIPFDLIASITKFRVEELSNKILRG